MMTGNRNKTRLAAVLVLVGATGLSGCEGLDILEGRFIPIRRTVVIDGQSYSALQTQQRVGPGGITINPESTITVAPGVTLQCEGEADGSACIAAVQRYRARPATPPTALADDAFRDSGHAD